MKDIQTSHHQKEENKDSMEKPEREFVEINIQVKTTVPTTSVSGIRVWRPSAQVLPSTLTVRSSSSKGDKAEENSIIAWMISLFFSLASLIIGCIYFDQCKIQPKIPVFLIVFGVLNIIQPFFAIWAKYEPKDSQGRIKDYRHYCKAVDCILQTFFTIWFVLGCIWVYRVYNVVEYQDTESNEYCNKTLYLYTFWLFTLTFMILALFVSVLICMFCGVCLIALMDKNNN